MSRSPDDDDMLRATRKSYASALASFTQSPSTFQILKTHPQTHTPPPPPKTLYVLDSSFNPPTAAHIRMALEALHNDKQGQDPRRLMLLLATQNADKGVKEAAFEDRLVMMGLMAEDVLETYGGIVDVAVTKKPFFHDKAAAIEESGVFGEGVEQVHLTGFDTVVRIFNAKYYPPQRKLAVLEPFLSRHRLRVTLRTGDEWGGEEEQRRYVRDMAEGKREVEGGKREWASRIELVEGRGKEEEIVSSTKAREAAKRGDGNLERFVSLRMKKCIVSERLYADD